MTENIKTVQALALADMLDRSECCQAMGGPGVHLSRCAECPRNAADELRRQHALIDAAMGTPPADNKENGK